MGLLNLLRQEPVRVYIYSLMTAVIGLLLYLGVLTGAAVPYIVAVVVAALALPSPVESLRNRVTPAYEPRHREDNS